MDEHEPQTAHPLATPISRRTALQVLGGAGITGALALGTGNGTATAAGRRVTHRALLAGRARRTIAGAPDFSAQVTRAKDMLLLTFDFYNMTLNTSGSVAQMVPITTTQPSYLVVVFPPQHFGEQALPEPIPPPAGWPSDPPYLGIVSNNSWLAFGVPGPIDFTVASLLTWTSLTPQLVPVAVPTAGAVPAQPSALQTSIEAPWSVVLSPDATGRWHHATAPITHSSITELWQTRLGTAKAEPPAVTPPIRAVWTPGYPNPPADPFTMALTPTNRADIVTLTSGGMGPTGGPIAGVPIPTDLLMLTPLGASLDLNGSWTPAGLSLIGWVQRSTTGRDSYVKTVTAGYLFPTGHKAVRITITDREFWVDSSGDVVANLIQNTYVDVVQPTVTYHGNPDEPMAGRQNPLRSITITTKATPSLDVDPVADPTIQVSGFTTDQAIFVRSGGQDVPFTHVATDVEGRQLHFTTGAIWVDEAALSTVVGAVSSLIADYESLDASRITPALGGQLLAFAQPIATGPGKTALHVDSYELGGVASLTLSDAPGYFPVMTTATVRLPAAEQITGSSLSAPIVAFDPDYLSGGFLAGHPEVYLDVLSGGPPLAFPGKNTGGSASPNFTVSAVTRDSGPAGGNPHNLRNGTFNPSDFFPPGNGALLLGAIEVADILEAILGSGSKTKGQTPKLQSALEYPGNNHTKPPTAITTTLDWSPSLVDDPTGIFLAKNGKKKAKIAIRARILTPFADPSATSFSVDVSLTNFELQLFGNAAPFIGITFKKVTFKFGTGSKTVVEPTVDSVTFLGPLTFINDLEQLLTSIGGPSIELSGGGITASYALPLPDIAVGVFALQNLKLDAGLTIPFDGTPVRARFGLCTRDDPFLLTIECFGGGGFFSIAVGADGIESLEVSLEFGAAIALDFGVASGSASIMAGIYFELQTVPSPLVQLTGFLKADGSLEVLGILTLSVELYLGFTYLDPGKAYGEATLTVSVKVFCFSASVSLTYQKRFGGSGDPTFGQALSTGDWSQYCGAFQ